MMEEVEQIMLYCRKFGIELSEEGAQAVAQAASEVSCALHYHVSWEQVIQGMLAWKEVNEDVV